MGNTILLDDILVAMGGALFGSIIMLVYKRLNNGHSDVEIKIARLEEKILFLERNVANLRKEIERMNENLVSLRIFLSGSIGTWEKIKEKKRE